MDTSDKAPLSLPLTDVPTRAVRVLATGASDAAVNNARGHRFEEFVSRLLEQLGYTRATRRNLNVTSAGIELDVVAEHALDSRRVIAECKAYSSPISAKELLAFYGKLNSERIDDPNALGIFVTTSSFVAPAREQIARITASEQHGFRALDAEGVIAVLEERGVIQPWSALQARRPQDLLSSETLLITEHGLYTSARVLDPLTRLATRIVVFSHDGRPVSRATLDMLGAAPESDGLPCMDANDGGASARIAAPHALPLTLVEVSGSSSDFEYQLPAAPAFLVGRKADKTTLQDVFRAMASSAPRACVVVLNAQSGWGKSSLALTAAQMAQDLGGVGLCIDSRTAEHPSFVTFAIQRALERGREAGIVDVPGDASFGDLAAALRTLARSTFTEHHGVPRPLAIFFDQFEGVFSDVPTTREFRNLALGAADLRKPILIGFSWKTDLVAFTENHPYQLRDDIRSRARVITLGPLGADEVGELLRRLQAASGQRLHRDLKDRLREHSQGLPWLFKKLASHIINELKRGEHQDRLISEGLNVQSLFDADISALEPKEREALYAIARSAPMAATDVFELAAHELVQTLLNQRLLVQIGGRIDIYWDIFRDYLNRGTVPLEDGYILRQSPNSTAKLLRVVVDCGGAMVPDDAASKLRCSRTVVFNMARDLRQLGVLSAVEGQLCLTADIVAAADKSTAIRDRVASALKRHRVTAAIARSASAAAGDSDGVRIEAIADLLPALFPAVTASHRTWLSYARTFVHWMVASGLAHMRGDSVLLGSGATSSMPDLLRQGKRTRSVGPVFPRCPPKPVMMLMGEIAGIGSGELSGDARKKAAAELDLLGWVVIGPDGRAQLSAEAAAIASASGQSRSRLLRDALDRQATFRTAVDALARDPQCSPLDLGGAIAGTVGARWSPSTARGVGKWARAWVRLTDSSVKRARSTKPQRDEVPAG